MSLSPVFRNPHPMMTSKNVFSFGGRRVKLPVVYALWSKGKVIYVGSTNCVRERVYENRYRDKCDALSYIVFKDRDQASDVEQMVIRLLNPEGNKTVDSFQYFGKLRKPKAQRRKKDAK